MEAATVRLVAHAISHNANSNSSSNSRAARGRLQRASAARLVPRAHLGSAESRAPQEVQARPGPQLGRLESLALRELLVPLDCRDPLAPKARLGRPEVSGLRVCQARLVPLAPPDQLALPGRKVPQGGLESRAYQARQGRQGAKDHQALQGWRGLPVLLVPLGQPVVLEHRGLLALPEHPVRRASRE